MSYRIKQTNAFKKKFRKLDFVTQRTIAKWIVRNLEEADNPRRQWKVLTGEFKGLWRYLIGDYRLIAGICDSELVIIALDIGHRREVYR